MLENHELLQAALAGFQHQHDEITRKIAEIRGALAGGKIMPEKTPGAPGGRRKMSAAARKRIAAAQRKRWAEYHAAQRS